MRTLITGGAGFIGSHLAEALLERGDEVLALDDVSTGDCANIAHLRGREGFRFIEADCAEPALLRDALPWCDLVFHLAASVGVRRAIGRAVETIGRNVAVAAAIFAAAARAGRPLVFTSSSEVYGKSERLPFREDQDLVIGPSPVARFGYASSKLLGEFLALAHAREHGVPVVVLRLFNTVGPRQSARHGMVLPRFIEQARAGGPLTVYGDGAQTRCFCDVEDVVRGLIAAGTSPVAGEVINLGNPDEVSIRALAERVRSIVNPAAAIELVPYEKAYGPGFQDLRRRVPDVSKAAQLLDWRPAIALDETIRRIHNAPEGGAGS